MTAYILRRLALVIPTLLGIMLVNFIVLQFLPGGPVEQIMAQLEGQGSAADRVTGGGSGGEGVQGGGGDEAGYKGAQGLREDLIEELKAEFGLDKPAWERFLILVWNYARFDFGESFFVSKPVIDLILEKLPVSITLGLWSTLIAYLISIPLGIRKAVRDGSAFDTWSSGIIIAAYAVPAFLFAIILLVFFAGGSYFQWFPLRGLGSDNWDELTFPGKVVDYLWHIVLPVTAVSIDGFARLTILTKNSFLDEINKQYVITARAKGLKESAVLYGHVFRNGMLIVIAGFPAVFIGVLFGSSLIIEYIFSLDGLGRLAFEAALERDYPVVLGSLYIFALLGLVIGIVTDLMYVWIDPRIDFESRET